MVFRVRLADWQSSRRIGNSLLSKDEHLTPNINTVMAVWVLEGGLKQQTLEKWTSRLWYFLGARKKKIRSKRLIGSLEADKFFKPNLGSCSLG